MTPPFRDPFSDGSLVTVFHFLELYTSTRLYRSPLEAFVYRLKSRRW